MPSLNTKKVWIPLVSFFAARKKKKSHPQPPSPSLSPYHLGHHSYLRYKQGLHFNRKTNSFESKIPNSWISNFLSPVKSCPMV